MKPCDICGEKIERNQDAFAITGGVIRHEDFVPNDESTHEIFCTKCAFAVSAAIDEMKTLRQDKEKENERRNDKSGNSDSNIHDD